MDPVTTSALATAVNAAASTAGGEAGRRALDALGTLYRRALGRGAGVPGQDPNPVPGPEPAPLPLGDAALLRELAALLVERARQEPEFARALAAWMAEHGPAEKPGAVHSTISDARITGSVVQGRDFNGPVTFGSP